jgi:hypothetical protein
METCWSDGEPRAAGEHPDCGDEHRARELPATTRPAEHAVEAGDDAGHARQPFEPPLLGIASLIRLVSGVVELTAEVGDGAAVRVVNEARDRHRPRDVATSTMTVASKYRWVTSRPRQSRYAWTSG